MTKRSEPELLTRLKEVIGRKGHPVVCVDGRQYQWERIKSSLSDLQLPYDVKFLIVIKVPYAQGYWICWQIT